MIFFLSKRPQCKSFIMEGLHFPDRDLVDRSDLVQRFYGGPPVDGWMGGGRQTLAARVYAPKYETPVRYDRDFPADNEWARLVRDTEVRVGTHEATIRTYDPLWSAKRRRFDDDGGDVHTIENLHRVLPFDVIVHKIFRFVWCFTIVVPSSEVSIRTLKDVLDKNLYGYFVNDPNRKIRRLLTIRVDVHSIKGDAVWVNLQTRPCAGSITHLEGTEWDASRVSALKNLRFLDASCFVSLDNAAFVRGLSTLRYLEDLSVLSPDYPVPMVRAEQVAGLVTVLFRRCPNLRVFACFMKNKQVLTFRLSGGCRTVYLYPNERIPDYAAKTYQISPSDVLMLRAFVPIDTLSLGYKNYDADALLDCVRELGIPSLSVPRIGKERHLISSSYLSEKPVERNIKACIRKLLLHPLRLLSVDCLSVSKVCAVLRTNVMVLVLRDSWMRAKNAADMFPDMQCVLESGYVVINRAHAMHTIPRLDTVVPIEGVNYECVLWSRAAPVPACLDPVALGAAISDDFDLHFGVYRTEYVVSSVMGTTSRCSISAAVSGDGVRVRPSACPPDSRTLHVEYVLYPKTEWAKKAARRFSVDMFAAETTVCKAHTRVSSCVVDGIRVTVFAYIPKYGCETMYTCKLGRRGAYNPEPVFQWLVAEYGPAEEEDMT